MNDHQVRFLRYECFLALGFGLVDSAKMLSAPNAKGVGKVSYFRWGSTC